MDHAVHLDKSVHPRHKHLPFVFLIAMEGTLFLLAAVLPLQRLGFGDALLTQLGSWPLFPAHILFPTLVVNRAIPAKGIPSGAVVTLSWRETLLLAIVFLIVFLCYLLALRYVPRNITQRYIFCSTALLGITCILFPVVTSLDIFSYIAYARVSVIYHLNPLTTLPTVIRRDPIYSHLYWNNQPSIYGPVWVAISYLLQWLPFSFGLKGILPMVLELRALGLVMHLGSTLLIWSIAGRLQRLVGFISPGRRVVATLAFAWNPLLLFEACVNAHVDTTLLFFILLAIWFLGQSAQPPTRAFLLAAALLAIATCIKLNVALFVPGLLFFLWAQSSSAGGATLPGGQGMAARKEKLRRSMLVIITYLGSIALLYTPFWQHGVLLHVFLVNPGTYRNINTLPDFLASLYNGIVSAFRHHVPAATGSRAEDVTHNLSVGIFVILYIILCWWAVRYPGSMSTLSNFIRWVALVWLLYCAIGSPWFWPWYTVTFFGLYALLEATSLQKQWSFGRLTIRFPLVVRLFTFSLLSLYCFFTWAPLNRAVHGLPIFFWSDFRGLWVWALPLLAVHLQLHSRVVPLSQRTRKLAETRWYEMRTLMGWGYQRKSQGAGKQRPYPISIKEERDGPYWQTPM